MNRFREIFLNIKFKLYYYVPPCPLCGSPVTGRYVKLHRDVDTEWQINESLRHGELIKALNEVPIRNCFCINCGYEWNYDAKAIFISQNELNEEKKKRHTIDILNKCIEEQKSEERKNHSLFKPIKKFIGKI